MIETKIKELDKYIEKNTKVEIKEIAKQLKHSAEFLRRDSTKQWLNSNRYIREEMPKYDAESQTDARLGRKDGSTQWHDPKNTVNSLVGIIEFEDFQKIEDEEWDRKIFINREVTHGRPWESPHTKVVMVEKNDPEMKQKNTAAFRNKFPVLAEIKEDFEILTMSVNRSTKKEERKDKVVKIVYDSEEKESVWKGLEKLRNELVGEEVIAMHSIKGMSTQKLRKMLEVVFLSTATRVVVYDEGEEEVNSGQTKNLKERKTYALVVDTSSGGYTETHKAVKKEFENNPANKVIKSIRSTREDKMLITIEKKEEIMKTLQEALEKAPCKIKATRRWAKDQELSVLHVRCMDELVTEQEVEKAILDRLGDRGSQYMRISSVRPDRNKTQPVPVTTNEDVAKLLLQKPIKIGLTMCTVERRIEPD